MQTKQYFLENRIAKSDNKSLNLFDKACPDFSQYKDLNPSKYMEKTWTKYKQLCKSSNCANGKVFEYILASILINKDIRPFYMQTNVTFIPGISYDILLYSKETGPIVLSAKTSLRERFRQADLEALVLRNVHRQAKSYLLTLEKDEYESISKEELIGLDDVFYCMDKKFDNFIINLTKEQLIEPEPINILTPSVLVK